MTHLMQSDDHSADLWLAYQRAMATYRLYARELEDAPMPGRRPGTAPLLDQEHDGPPSRRGQA